MVKLSELGLRECGVVDEIDADEEEFDRLKSMGLCKGRALELVKHGDPLILRVYGTRIGMSLRLADRIKVHHCADARQALKLARSLPFKHS